MIYFPSSHLDFLRKNGRKLKERIDFEDLLPENKSSFEGTIEELEYIPDENVKCKIVLKIMIGRKPTRIKFHYFFAVNQPNFLVLKTIHESNNNLKFKLNETVKIRVPPCQDENGIILDIKDESSSSVAFGVYKVLW